MTLAVLTDSLSRNAGGMFESVRRLSQEMHRWGVTVHVFGVTDKWTNEDLLQWRPLEVSALPCLGPQFVGYAPGLVEAVKAVKPTSIQVHGLWQYSSLATLRLTAKLRCPYVVNPHGMLDPWALRHSRWKKWLALRLYEGRHLRGAACLRALCRSEAEAFRACGLRNPICIIPNAIDLPLQIADDQDAHKPFPDGRKTLLYIGRLHPKKGLRNLLEAWAIVQKSLLGGRRPDEWVLAIVGWDQRGHEARLKRLATDLGLGESVAFLGARFGKEKAACYRHCDAFVLPSLSEGLPMVILEAWAYAKPVLMTRECNLPEGVLAGAAVGMETDTDSIVMGLRTVLEMSDADRQTMGQRGLALVKQRHHWPEVARQMVDIQRWVREQGPQPTSVEFA